MCHLKCYLDCAIHSLADHKLFYTSCNLVYEVSGTSFMGVTINFFYGFDGDSEGTCGMILYPSFSIHVS